MVTEEEKQEFESEFSAFMHIWFTPKIIIPRQKYHFLNDKGEVI